MNLYLVFAGANYYPSGGEDLRFITNHPDQAFRKASELVAKPSYFDKGHDWSEVYEVKGVTFSYTKLARFWLLGDTIKSEVFDG